MQAGGPVLMRKCSTLTLIVIESIVNLGESAYPSMHWVSGRAHHGQVVGLL